MDQENERTRDTMTSIGQMDETTTVYYVPAMTPIGFGDVTYFYDHEGNQLS